jgi:hypothetical protein
MSDYDGGVGDVDTSPAMAIGVGPAYVIDSGNLFNACGWAIISELEKKE